MKCEMCHKLEAAQAIKKAIAGEVQELYVCNDCARLEVSAQTTARSKADTSSGTSAEGVEAVAALPLMGMIIDAAFEIIGRASSLVEPKCPQCGITRQEYRNQSRLGCPECYAAFAQELEMALLDLHRATGHVGKVPAQAQVSLARHKIEQALAGAVQNQQYEEAIQLRDQLLQMEAKLENPPKEAP